VNVSRVLLESMQVRARPLVLQLPLVITLQPVLEAILTMHARLENTLPLDLPLALGAHVASTPPPLHQPLVLPVLLVHTSLPPLAKVVLLLVLHAPQVHMPLPGLTSARLALLEATAQSNPVPTRLVLPVNTQLILLDRVLHVR